jgi:hypothetical protein
VISSPRFITLAEIARDRCYDLTDPRALANCREWLRRKGLRSTGGGRFNREQYLVVMERLDRTPKAKATEAQQRARALNLAHGRQQVRVSHAATVNGAADSSQGNSIAGAR